MSSSLKTEEENVIHSLTLCALIMKKKAEIIVFESLPTFDEKKCFQSDKWDLALGKSFWVPKVPQEPMRISQSCHQAWSAESSR